MFEKEAEEYVMREDVITENDKVPFDNGYGFQTVSFEDEVKKGFKDGAEFGYNKGYHDAEEHYMNVIDSQHKLVEKSKANEWHYTKYELPPEDVPLLCMRGGNVYVAWFILGKWKGDKYNDVKKPYAWKEVVLPELPKESE